MNEGMFSEIKRLLGELIIRHDRLISLIEAQMTQPLEDKPVERFNTEGNVSLSSPNPAATLNIAPKQAPVTAKTMPKEEPVHTTQSWPNYDPPHPTEVFPEKRATGAPMRPTKK